MTAESTSRKKILIIEDELSTISNLSSALSDFFDVVSATTADEGLRKIKKESPDLVLLDIMLPDKSGIEILHAVRQDEYVGSTDIWILTNLSDPDTVGAVVAAGGREYLVKPDWGIMDIVERIKLALS